MVGEPRSPPNLQSLGYGHLAAEVKMFLASGLRLYNQAVLLTPLGSLPLRAKFWASRKLGTTHQYYLGLRQGRRPLRGQGLSGGVMTAHPAPPFS